MTVNLSQEQESVLLQAVNLGIARDPGEALDQALEGLRHRLSQNPSSEGDSTAAAVRRLANFGREHGLTLGDLSVKDLLRESRP